MSLKTGRDQTATYEAKRYISIQEFERQCAAEQAIDRQAAAHSIWEILPEVTLHGKLAPRENIIALSPVPVAVRRIIENIFNDRSYSIDAKGNSLKQMFNSLRLNP